AVAEAEGARGRDLLGHALRRSIERAGLENEADTVRVGDGGVHPRIDRRRVHPEVGRVVRLADVVHVLAVVERGFEDVVFRLGLAIGDVEEAPHRRLGEQTALRGHVVSAGLEALAVARQAPVSTSIASSIRSRLSSLRSPNAMYSYSLYVEPRPMPTSRRPRLRLSSTASWMARRTGWCNAISMTANPIRTRDVRAASAPA